MTAEIFSILRLQPVLGTFFTKEQNKQGADKVIVLTQSYWQTQYQESPEVFGKEVRIDDEAYQIIGVAPRELEAFDARMKFVVPLSWPPAAENPQGRYGVGIQLFGRLKPGVTAAQADAEAKVLEKRYVDAGPPPLKAFVERSGMTMNVGGVQEQRVQPVRAILLMLQGGVAFVLLIGCVNVANLLLVRSNARQSELAIRSALGAARSTIARQFLMESLLLTSLGTLLGVGLAWGVLRVTNYYLAKMLPQSLPASLDWRVLAFAVALTAVVGLLIGLIPVFHILRTNLAAVIQSNSRGSSSSRGVRALSSALVVAQVAVALVLLTGAGLLIYSFAEACESRYRTRGGERGHGAHRADARTSRQRRGRQLDSRTPVAGDERDSGGDVGGAVHFDAIPGGTADQRVHPGERHPAAGLAAAGRLSGDRDAGVRRNAGTEAGGRPLLRRRGSAPGRRQFVVDQSFARKFFPNGSALGGRFAFGGRPAKPDEWPVDHRGRQRRAAQRGRGEERQPVHLSTPAAGRTTRRIHDVPADEPVDGDAVAALRNKVRAIDPASPLFEVGVLQEAVDSSFDNRRAVMLLLAAFAGLAVFLSALGIYGVQAYDVSQRTREIGVLSAIGASRGQISGHILKQGLWKGGIGVGLGLIGAVATQQVDHDAALQRPADRSRSVCRGVVRADRRGAPRQLSAGPPRVADRSASCLA